MTGISDEAALKKELAGLFQYMQRVREEIAAIHFPADEEHRFEKMSDLLLGFIIGLMAFPTALGCIQIYSWVKAHKK